MVIETALGHVQFGGDFLDRRTAITQLIDQPRRREQERLAAWLGLVMGEVDQLGRPACVRPGNAVREHVHQTLLDARILVEIIAVEPDRQPERVFQKHVRSATMQVGLRTVGGRAPQAAGLSEHFAPARHQPTEHGLLHRAQIRQNREGCLLAPLNPRQPRHVERQIFRDSGAGRRLGERLLEHAQQTVQCMLETRCRQIFLALEIIGDAGGIEADAARDIGEGHALRALFVDRFGRGRQNRVALGAKALGAGVFLGRNRVGGLHAGNCNIIF
ncbi:hypothetical protein D9M73_106350 [compost metagenome]